MQKEFVPIDTEQVQKVFPFDLFTQDARKLVNAQNLLYFDTIDSTNSFLKRNAQNLQHGTVAIAQSQSAGRGRMGRSFYSPKSTGLYFSMLFSPSLICKNAQFTPALFTTSAAVAVVRAIQRFVNIKVDIKWVNDIYLDGKKIAGILCEAISALDAQGANCTPCNEMRIVCGIGVNLTTQNFPQELVQKAGNLFAQDAHNKNCALQLCAHIINEYVSILHCEDANDVMNEYIANSLVIGKVVRVSSPYNAFVPYNALAESITKDGFLCVRPLQDANSSPVLLDSAEVSIQESLA